jgi:hypothetical protein
LHVWCMCLFCVCVALRLGRGLATGWSLLQGVLPSVKMIMKLKAGARAQGGCRASEKVIFILPALWVCRLSLYFVGSEVLRVRDMTPCSQLNVSRRFWATCRTGQHKRRHKASTHDPNIPGSEDCRIGRLWILH